MGKRTVEGNLDTCSVTWFTKNTQSSLMQELQQLYFMLLVPQAISQMLSKESLSQLQLYKHHKSLPDYVQLSIQVIQRQLKASI